MLKATLLQPCLHPQATCAGSNPKPHSSPKPMPDPEEIYDCLGRLQGMEKEINQICQQVGKSCPSEPKEADLKDSEKEDFPPESWRIDGDVFPFKKDDRGRASVGGCLVTRDSPRPASDLLHSGLNSQSDHSQEWKVVKVKRVLICPVGEPRKASK